MSQTPTFATLYQQLNPLQKQAVDHIEQGPLLLIAGPGTGKTQVLALRIANILRLTDARPENILALTFTEAAAKNMRERLLRMIGKDAYYLHIHTFHSFCRQVIADHGEYFPLARNSEHLDDLARYQLFEQLIDELEPEHLRPLNDKYFYVKDIIKAISDLKREGVSVLQFEEMVKALEADLEELRETSKSKTKLASAQKQLDKNKNLLLLYQTYQIKLQELQRFDYDDMINLVVQAFREHELLLREYQENLHYFLVDEYQDSNSAQNALVNTLAAYWEEQDGMADLFVVGDPNQAIYRFQGASIENVLAFTRTYPSATVITLDTAYRCPQNIYDLATEVISYNQLSKLEGIDEKINLVTRLKSPKGEGVAINFFTAPSQLLEAVMVAEEIKRLQEQGVQLREIAVLYRNHQDAVELENALRKWQLPYQLSRGENVLDNLYVDQLILVLQLLLELRNGTEVALLYQSLNLPWLGVDQLLVMKLGRVAGQLRINLYDLLHKDLAEINQHLVGQEIKPTELEQVQTVLAKMQQLVSLDQQVTFPDFFTRVIGDEGFGLVRYLQQLPDSFIQLQQLNALYAAIKAMAAHNHQAHLSDFLAMIATYRHHAITIQAPATIDIADAVTLSTVHGAKGMEWQHVFLIQLVDKKWGNKRALQKIKLPEGIIKNTNLETKERNEDDRRLLYVALTRAKEQLHLSMPSTMIEGANSTPKFPSIFLTEIQEIEQQLQRQFLASQTHQAILDQAPQHLATLLAQPQQLVVTSDQRAYLQTLVRDFSLSVTALNTYLRDPLEFLKNTLLRLPRVKQPHMAFGTAVHQALERFYRLYQQQQSLPQSASLPSIEFLLQEFSNALATEILVESDFRQWLAHGQELLRNFYEARLREPVQVFDVERAYAGKRKVFLGDIQLTGKIDRLDVLDQDRKLLRVIDYKTGNPKSANFISGIGKTATADFSERELALPETIRGSYKRQLVFYRLLIDLDRTLAGNWRLEQAVFDFVQPRESGSFAREAFVITDEEVADLKTLIKQVMQEIRELQFL